ncbi:MAG TPA: hypothetical protein VH475_12720 [Tepidisphaeraceae bacterium]
MKHTTLLLCVLCVSAVNFTARALDEPDKLPSGPGLAARYPADAGIAKDAAVFLADDFESGDLKKWDDKSGTIAVVGDAPHAGSKCVTAPMEKGKSTGGEAKKWFGAGADRVFARVYVKFSDDYQYCHHFLTLLATDRRNRWSAFGKAGLKPDGKTWFCAGMEPWFAWGKNPSPGEINFYSYYMDMEIDPKMNKYWGNGFFPPGPAKGRAGNEKTRVIPKLNQWQCWEFMVQANTPGKADGRQAMWLDGQLIGDFSGIRWRDDAGLKVNCFWLQHYGYDSSDPTRGTHKEHQAVWFDDVVIAREYVGPRIER